MHENKSTSWKNSTSWKTSTSWKNSTVPAGLTEEHHGWTCARRENGKHGDFRQQSTEDDGKIPHVEVMFEERKNRHQGQSSDAGVLRGKQVVLQDVPVQIERLDEEIPHLTRACKQNQTKSNKMMKEI